MQINKEQDLPIDIHTNKLLDWLLSRRHCSKEWQAAVLVIREKINNAIQDMPAVDEITQLLSGTYINYFHCTRIVELLKQTESSTKNIFGHYSSQRMKDWQEIMKFYEKENVYLAEAAQMLIRNVNYEVPSLKRQIARCQQVQEECTRKSSDYAKNANELKDRYHATCKELGISGNNILQELMSLVDDLPPFFSLITEEVLDLKTAMEYYSAFLIFTLSQMETERDCLPLLKHMVTKGNTTTYEWRTGKLPEIIEECKSNITVDMDDGQHGSDDQIDFGDNGDAIDFGDDQSCDTPNGDFVHIEKIDFGEGEQVVEVSHPNEDIRWDITVDTGGSASPDAMEVGTENGKVARGDDAKTVLENPATRSIFVNELLELEGFLKQRITEMQAEGDVLSANQFHQAPSIIQLQSVDGIQSMLSVVLNIIQQMSNERMQHLFLIKNSPKYVYRLAESLKQKLALGDKMLQSQNAVIEKRGEALEEQKTLEPRLDLVIEKTLILQKQIEDDISKRYKGRPVNIMGGIAAM